MIPLRASDGNEPRRKPSAEKRLLGNDGGGKRKRRGEKKSSLEKTVWVKSEEFLEAGKKKVKV